MQKYVANHEFGKGPEKFHKASCDEVKVLQSLSSRDYIGEEGPGLVTNKMPADIRLRPNLGYSDSRNALIEQGFTPCKTCKP